MGERRGGEVRTCAGEVSGVVAAGCLGVAGVDGGDEEGEDGQEGGEHGCEWVSVFLSGLVALGEKGLAWMFEWTAMGFLCSI